MPHTAPAAVYESEAAAAAFYARVMGAHELCASALGVHTRGKSLEDLLETAELFELRRPLVA